MLEHSRLRSSALYKLSSWMFHAKGGSALADPREVGRKPQSAQKSFVLFLLEFRLTSSGPFPSNGMNCRGQSEGCV